MTSFRLFLFPVRHASDVAPLQLYPVYFAGMTQPVEDGDGGINLQTFEENEAGIFSLIDPYQGMGTNDKIEVFWNETVIHTIEVKAEHVNERLFFYLPKTEIVPGFATCHYQVTRAGEPLPDEASVVLKLLVKLNKPAGEDEEQHLPWHSHLDMVGLPQDVIDNGVTAPWADKGVPMTIKHYRDIRAHDVIWVWWGNMFLAPHVVTQAEADGTQDIIITATPGDIKTAGDSAALLIKYEVHDEVWNYCEKWSKETTVSVDAGAVRLGAPIFEDANNGELHLEQLDHQATHLLIKVETGDEFAAGDTIVIKITGVGSPGTAPRTLTEEVTVGSPPYIHEFPVPFAFVSLFATGTLDGSYQLRKKDGSLPLYSKRTFVKVIGNPALLPAPTIDEVVGAILPADSATASVRIAYLSLKVGDTVNMIWQGTESDGTPYLYEEPYDISNNDEQAGLTYLYVMNEHILRLNNGSLKLRYRVYNEDAGDYGLSESDYLRVEVRALPATLPAPDVEEAVEGVIDPTLVYTQAHVLVKPVNWVKGDTLTYHWSGVTAYGSTKGSVPITQLTIDKTVRFRVDAHYVTSNIGFPVTVIYTLLHSTTGKYSYSAPFRVIVGVPLGRLLAPKVIQASGDILDPMEALNGVDIECDYDTMDEKLDVLRLLWTGSPGPGTSHDLEKPGQATGPVTFLLPPSVVGANILGTVSVKYAVQRHNIWTQSEELVLNVSGFDNPDMDLPTPEVPLAVNAVLDLMEFSGDARVVVKPWPFIAKGQFVEVNVVGRTNTADTHIIQVFKTHISEEQAMTGLDEPLFRADLLELKHSSPMTVTCSVIFNGSDDASVEFPSLPLTIRTRYDYVTPVITSVKDPQGKEILEATVTYDKRVTIQGTATRGEKVNVKINDALQGTVDVVAAGTWELTTVALIEGMQRITVEALYDADPATSLPRTFTIGIATRPSITEVNDSLGPVANNGTTYDTEIEMAVSADPNQSVQLYNGMNAIGTAIALDADGAGRTTLLDLTGTTYALKARAIYGDQLESPAHNFTIKAHSAITLTSIRHSAGELAEGGRTYDSSVTLTGAFTALYGVQVYDNGIGKQEVRTNQSGIWTTSLAVEAGEHAVYVKALSTDQQS